MYFPYVRGKQNELLLLKEQSELIGKSGKIVPIIEPVKENLNPLERAIKELNKNHARYVLIANPNFGDFVKDTLPLLAFIETLDKTTFTLGLLITENSDLNQFEEKLEALQEYSIAIIHQGFSNGKELAEICTKYSNIQFNIFISLEPNKLYQKHFKGIGHRILIRDGFKKQLKNANYPDNEHFSDLHITYEEENVDGFGDFLIVGSEYSESGGPAWSVAIHMTYLNDEDNMFIKHYVSDRQDDNKDAGGKFLEALNKLVKDEIANDLYDTKASKEYIELHKQELFRGLGYAKKLSMQNHLEIVARYLG